MKNTGSKIVCKLYCDLKKKPLFSVKGRSLDTANIAEMKGYRVRTSPLLTLYCLNLQTLENKTKQNKTKPSHQITETVRLILEISRTFKDHE